MNIEDRDNNLGLRDKLEIEAHSPIEALAKQAIEDIENTDKCCICSSTNIYKYDGHSRPWCRNCVEDAVDRRKPILNRGIRVEPKQGRNESCRCGSGRKAKRCCN